MGVEECKKVAESMRPIKQVKIEPDMAIYRITREEGDKEFAYEIYFIKEYDEWRIDSY